ncbi:FAD-binding oxidoreductase [Tamlana crocina]|uniref:Flavodoxin reductase n=1 Tax=Tamlana crocina TaxID=393006 RepID=A0ABX1DDD2_9FLAO|nr:FAD-binding oxidoreductase [Tamlana crocina]NJX15074.1 flavodoxin reductase [Tamlana crocina]
MEHKVTLRKIEHVNHNVLHLVTDKPKGYQFTPGQATELSIDKPGWADKKRPFTFTNLPEDKELEFTIKIYPSHNGVTEQLEKLQVGDQLLIGDAWGAIQYKGKGAFIAGGAGVTPFISILKDLKQKGELQGNQLFFSNNEERDFINKNNLEAWLGNDLHLILSEEEHSDYAHGFIDKAFLEKHNLEVSRPVYLCGPPPMMEAVEADLYKMGLPKSHLVVEE